MMRRAADATWAGYFSELSQAVTTTIPARIKVAAIICVSFC